MAGLNDMVKFCAEQGATDDNVAWRSW